MIMGLEVFNNDVVSMCNPHFGVQSNPLFNIHVSFFAMSQVRQEIDRRIQEKKKEFEHSRKNHQRALESMQASLEAEARHPVARWSPMLGEDHSATSWV